MDRLKAGWMRLRPRNRRRTLFLCYRREDTEGTTGRLSSRLARWYGRRYVFRDRESIDAGDEWPTRTQDYLARSDVVLVIIGKDWVLDRLNTESDFVRLEIETALADETKTVIPLLVQEAELPTPEELPESLRPLLGHQVREIRPGRFDDDVRALIKSIGGARLPRLLNVSVGTWLVGSAMLLTLLAGYIAFKPTPSPEPQKMTGEMNIAVAEFGAAPPGDEAAPVDNALSLADSVYRFLEDQTEEFRSITGDDVQIRSPAETGPIAGSDRSSRAEAARQLARDIDADLVLYGVLTSEPGGTTFTPEFILADRKLQGAEELVGHYELGEPVERPGSPDDSQKAIRLDLEARTVAFARFVIGLTHYRIGDYEGATQYFTEALSAEAEAGAAAWRDEDGKEVLYLFLGNAAGKAKSYDVAETHYNTALDLSHGEYARAHVGLGEVARVRSGCVSRQALDGFDRTLMDEAYAAYQTAENARIRPAVSEIDAKAALGKGWIHVCRSLDGPEEWSDAEEQYRNVIGAYRAGDGGEINSRVEELAADAYFGLGLALAVGAEPESEAAAYVAAIEAFEQALELEERLVADNLRRGLIHGWVGWLNDWLGNVEIARQHCMEARQLDLDPATGFCPVE